MSSLLLALAAGAFVQERPLVELRPGETHEGTLEPAGSPPRFVLVDGEGQELTLELRSFDFDVVLAVEDPGGAPLAEDDDGGVETDAQLVLAQDRPARCVVVVRSNDLGRGGAYLISAERGRLAPLGAAMAQEAAIVYRATAAERALDRGEHELAAWHRLEEGNRRYERSDFDRAVGAFDAARGLSSEAGARGYEAQAHTGLGRCAYARSDYPTAVEHYEEALELYRGMGERLDEGRTLLNLGMVSEIRQDYATAEGCYEGALGFAEAVGDELGRARALTKLGNVQRLRGQNQSALELLEQGLEACRTLGDRPGECAALEGMGHLVKLRGRPEEAVRCFEAWLAIAEEDRDRASEAAALTSLAMLYSEQSDQPRAIAHLERALALATEVGDRIGQATALGNLGVAYVELQDWERALEYHQKHLEKSREIGDRQGEQRALLNLSTVWERMGNSEQREASVQAELEDARRVGDRRRVGDALIALANTRRRQGRFQEALDLLAQAGSGDGSARNRGLAEVYLDMGRPQDALGPAQRAVESHRSNRLDPSFTLRTLARVHLALDSPREARDALRASLDAARIQGAPQLIANLMEELGFAEAQIGMYDSARRNLAGALELARERKLRGIEMRALMYLGAVSAKQGDLADCRQKMEAARALLGDDELDVQAWIDSALGWYLFEAGELAEAQDLNERALAYYATQTDTSGQRNARGNLACIHAELGDLDRAQELAQTLLAERHADSESGLVELGDPLWTLARVAAARGDPDGARPLLEELGGLVERALRHGYRGAVGLGAFDYLLVGWERTSQDVLALRAALSGEARAELLASGFRLAGRSKDRALLGGIVEHRRGGRSSESIELRQRRDARIAEREAVLNRLARAVPDGMSVAESDALRTQAADQEREIDELERTLRAIAPRDARLELPEGVAPEEVRAAGLAAGDALIEYVEGDRKLYAYVLTSTELALVELGVRPALEASVAEYVRAIGSPGELGAPEKVLELGRRLGAALLEPALARAGKDIQRLVIVPTAALSGLAFEALVLAGDQAADLRTATFALDRFEIAYAPSAPVLVELAALGPRRRQGRVLVLADPVYASEAPAKAAEAPTDAPALLGGVRALPNAGEFERLPKTREEALALADLLVPATEPEPFEQLANLRRARGGSLESRFLDLHLGSAASTARLRGDLAPYAIVHLAAHGFVDRSQADHSGVALAFDPKDAQQGYFTVADALDLDLDANLVVLSACDTARGQRRAGEGVESLARAFIFSGARGVVASLWQVSDKEAAETMVAFYRGALQDGLTPSRALREAKLALRRSGEVRGVAAVTRTSQAAAHPYFWAPFVYVGRLE